MYIHSLSSYLKLRIHLRTFCSWTSPRTRYSCNWYRVCKQFVANHLLSVFPTNTEDIHSSVGNLSEFVLLHVCRKIFLSRQQFSCNCWGSWFVIFPRFAGITWKNKFSEHVRECIRSLRHTVHTNKRTAKHPQRQSALQEMFGHLSKQANWWTDYLDTQLASLENQRGCLDSQTDLVTHQNTVPMSKYCLHGKTGSHLSCTCNSHTHKICVRIVGGELFGRENAVDGKVRSRFLYLILSFFLFFFVGSKVRVNCVILTGQNFHFRL